MGTYSSAIFKKVLGTLFGSDSSVAVWGGITGTIGDQVDLAAAIAAATGGWTYVMLGADFTTTSGTAVNVTNFNFTPAANAQYVVEGLLMLETTDTAAGARAGMAWPTGCTNGVGRIDCATSSTSNAPGMGNINAALFGASGGATTANASFPAPLVATFITGASPGSTFRIQLHGETATTVTYTMKAGSYFRYKRIV